MDNKELRRHPPADRQKVKRLLGAKRSTGVIGLEIKKTKRGGENQSTTKYGLTRYI
jgi:hypothetical protein